jgi:hypothetical protein
VKFYVTGGGDVHSIFRVREADNTSAFSRLNHLHTDFNKYQAKWEISDITGSSQNTSFTVTRKPGYKLLRKH